MNIAVIFDMDGVIIDSEPIYFKLSTAIFNKYGLKFDEKNYSEYKGTSYHEIREVLKKKLLFQSEEQINKFLKETIEIKEKCIQEQTIPLIQGIVELLSEIKTNNIITAIASSSDNNFILKIVEQHNLSTYFNAIIGINHVKRGKPEPDLFLYAAKKLKIVPAQCVVIEDSTHGVKAALAAGMKCIGFDHYHDQNLSGCNYIVNNLKEINVSLLKRLF